MNGAATQQAKWHTLPVANLILKSEKSCAVVCGSMVSSRQSENSAVIDSFAKVLQPRVE